MDRLADGDERGQRIAHDGKAQRAPESVRHRGKLERELRDEPPAVRTETAGERERHEDRDGECAILAVAACNCGGEKCGTPRSVAGVGSAFSTQPSLGVLHDDGKLIVGIRRAECGPAQRGCRDVRLAPRRVTPSTVDVHIIREPSQAAADERGMLNRIHFCQRDNCCRSRERAAGKLARPVPGGIHLREQCGTCALQCGCKPGLVFHRACGAPLILPAAGARAVRSLPSPARETSPPRVRPRRGGRSSSRDTSSGG